jgi:hypothetical protein
VIAMTLDQAIAALRERNEEVPTPPRLPTDDEINETEKLLKVKFHPHYRKFLKEASDIVFGTLEPATITDPDSHTHLPDVAESAWDEMELPRKYLPICEDNGDYYCMTKSGRIAFWSHNDKDVMEEWDDLAAWIEEVWIGENE